MFVLPKPDCTILSNTSKHPSVAAWVELCDLRAAKAPALFIHADPQLGSSDRMVLVTEPVSSGVYFTNYELFEKAFTFVETKIQHVILPELKDVYIGHNEVYIDLPDRIEKLLTVLMDQFPDLHFGLGVQNVRA